MITRYDVGYEKDGVTLIVNLDFKYEIADFNFKGFSKNLKEEIMKLAKKKNAKKIKIIMDGILISTLLLAPLHIEDSYNNSTTFITNNTIKNVANNNVIDDDILIIDDSVDTNESINNEDITSNNKENITNNISNNENVKPNTSNNNVSTNTTTKPSNSNNNTNTVKPSIPNNNTSSNTSKNNQTTTEIINKNEEVDNNTSSNTSKNNQTTTEIINKNEEVDNNTYVTVYRKNGSVVKLELEEYLIGVVASEMPASFNSEALKAQAIVARTYALKRISENKTLTDTVSTQVYKDNTELKDLWKNDFNKYYSKVKNAVESTKGIVLTYNGAYIDAVYHSTSNGMTEDAIYVWGNNIPYLKSVESKSDKNVSSYKREVTFTYEKLSNALNTEINKDTTFVLERNSSGRVTNVKVNDIEIKGTTFRSLLGLRSTDFTIELASESVIITTYGYGHGVGMSQYGANSLANMGYSYKSILSHYYQNISFTYI